MRRGLFSGGGAMLLLGALTLGGCATTEGVEREERSSRDVLTREDLSAYDHLEVERTIRQLRPRWFRSLRGTESLTPQQQGQRGLRVYIDGSLVRDANPLRSLQTRHVEEIRFLDKRRATTRFGIDHGEGALLITTRRG